MLAIRSCLGIPVSLSTVSYTHLDIIEYELKMSQFRDRAKQIRLARIDEEERVKCPRCGSTNITTGQRGFKLTTGFIGSNKTVNRCGNCGYSWKP